MHPPAPHSQSAPGQTLAAACAQVGSGSVFTLIQLQLGRTCVVPAGQELGHLHTSFILCSPPGQAASPQQVGFAAQQADLEEYPLSFIEPTSTVTPTQSHCLEPS